MSYFKKYIENKRVIFVGPAQSIVKKTKGKFINSFEAVARTNGAIFLLDNRNYQLDYGSKCTILYTNVQFHRESGPFTDEQLMDWKRKYNLQFLCMKTCSQIHFDRYNKIICTRTIGDVIGELHKQIQGALMGPILLTDLANHNPKRLYFTGMDFYINKPDMFIPGDYREYFPGYMPDKIVKKADIANIGRVDPHDQYSNAKYLYDMCKKGILETDQEIINIMETILDNPKYYSYQGKLERVGRKK